MSFLFSRTLHVHTFYVPLPLLLQLLGTDLLLEQIAPDTHAVLQLVALLAALLLGVQLVLALVGHQDLQLAVQPVLQLLLLHLLRLVQSDLRAGRHGATARRHERGCETDGD